MKKNICFTKEKLLALLPDYHIVKVKTIDEDEDTYSERERNYIVKKDVEVTKICYYYSLWTSVGVYLENGDKLTLYGNNINGDDESLLRVRKNEYISPRLNISDDYIASTEEVREWILNLGVSEKELDAISESFNVYEIMEYPGVGTPHYYPPNKELGLNGSWGISNEDLKLDEREIEKVLGSIEDMVLRKKIELILYARVFKSRR